MPGLTRRAPDALEAEALRDLDGELAKLPADASAEDIQTQVFEVGKRHPFEMLRGWFQALYETLLGSAQGPRMGSFIALYGIDNSRAPDRRGARPAVTQSPAPRLRKSCGRLRGPRRRCGGLARKWGLQREGRRQRKNRASLTRLTRALRAKFVHDLPKFGSIAPQCSTASIFSC